MLDTYELAGRRDSMVGVWLDSSLRALGLKPATPVTLPYTIPSHPVARGSAYNFSGESEAFDGLVRWFDAAAEVLEEVRTGYTDGRADAARCWPHHFDIATVVALDPPGAATARSIGIGMVRGLERSLTIVNMHRISGALLACALCATIARAADTAPAVRHLPRPDHVVVVFEENRAYAHIIGNMGGYYAPRAAAMEPRFAACVAWGGHWDYHESWVRRRRIMESGGTKLSAPSFQLPWVLGMPDMDACMKKLENYRLAGVAEKMRCPFYCIHGENDNIVPLEFAQKLYDACGSEDKTLKVLTTLDGGSDHCQEDNRQVGSNLVADWLAQRLGGRL